MWLPTPGKSCPTRWCGAAVAVGVGHDGDWWTEYLRAIRDIDPDMAVDIEHEDRDYDKVEGLGMAARVLLEAAKKV